MIRHGGIDDLPEIMRLLVRFHAENGLVPLDPDKVVQRVGRLIADDGLFVAEVGTGLAGMVGVVENEFWYGRGSYLTDSFFYVEPEFRSDGIGEDLLREVKAESTRRGDIPVLISVLNPARAKRRGRIASVLGYLNAGYLVRLK